MTSTLYPSGQTLASSALTLSEIQELIQQLTLGMIGQPVVAESSAVRIEFPTQGAPFAEVSVDVCYIRCMTQDNPYDKIRYKFLEAGPGDLDTELQNYTRTWKIHWCFYGPNSTDNARALKSGLFQDWACYSLAQSNLFAVTDYPEPIRAPENINGQWWERVDFEATYHEFVTETIEDQTVLSVETIVNDNSGVTADFTTTKS
jgi:hypothetical protein